MLHVHSCFQLMESTVIPEKYVIKAKELGFRTVSINDREMYGCQKLSYFATQHSLCAIFGKEFQTPEGRVSFFALDRQGYFELVRFHNGVFPLTSLLDSVNIVKIFHSPKTYEALKKIPNAYYGYCAISEVIEHPLSVFFLPVVALSQPELEAYRALALLKKEPTATTTADALVKPEEGIFLLSEQQLLQKYAHLQPSIARLFSLLERFSSYSLQVATTIPLPATAKAYSSTGLGKPEEEMLLQYVEEQLQKIPSERRKEYEERANYELTILLEKKFARYLLLAKDFIDCCKKVGAIVGAGRGSSVASLVVHLLGITKPDPLLHKLIFERFMHSERNDPPDIDIDVEDTLRNQVLNEIRDRYTAVRVAQIATFGTFGEINLNREIEKNLPLQQYLQNCTCKQEVFDCLSNLPHFASVHAAGIIVTEQNLQELIPLTLHETQTITQFDMNDLSQLEIIKFDILGLSTLSILKQIGLNYDSLPLEDKSVYEHTSPDTLSGVFQLDSVSGRKLVKSFHPKSFSDLRILISLNRPGPLQSGIDNKLIRASEGSYQPVFAHPLLKEILQDTFGFPIFQEQILEIAMKIGNLTPAQADTLRIAMAKKLPELMNRYRKEFLAGAIVHHIDQPFAEKVFKDMESFAGYAFNKAHATAYAMMTFWLLYAKHYHPFQFYKTLLNHHSGNPEKCFDLLQEMRRVKIHLLPPDVNNSEMGTTQENGDLRAGFYLITEGFTPIFSKIIELRRQQKFSTLKDFFQRMQTLSLPDRVLYKLFTSGCLNSLESDMSFEELKDLRDEQKTELLFIKNALFGEKPKIVPKKLNLKAHDDLTILENQMHAFGFLVEYEKVFGLLFSPFSFLSFLKLGIITQVIQQGKTFEICDGKERMLVDDFSGRMHVGDAYIVIANRMGMKPMGCWEKSNNCITIEGNIFFANQRIISEEMDTMRSAGVKKLVIHAERKRWEVVL